MPGRWYLAVNADGRLGGSTLLRTDDDGATWVDILEFRGGGTQDPNASSGDVWDVQIHGLAYDISQTDTVYVARTATSATTDWTVPITSGVAVSTDVGQTWSDSGSQQLGTITDLAFTGDGSHLLLASDEGLFMRSRGW